MPECINITLSHIPDDDVEVRAVFDSEAGGPAFEMAAMDPNFEDWTDPNHLLFTPGTYNIGQELSLSVIDDDDSPAEGQWVPGEILFSTVISNNLFEHSH